MAIPVEYVVYRLEVETRAIAPTVTQNQIGCHPALSLGSKVHPRATIRANRTIVVGL